MRGGDLTGSAGFDSFCSAKVRAGLAATGGDDSAADSVVETDSPSDLTGAFVRVGGVSGTLDCGVLTVATAVSPAIDSLAGVGF